MPTFPKPHAAVPALTVAQMIRVDELMTGSFGISLPQMMENAGRCLAMAALRLFLRDRAQGRSVVVLAGTGGNGGGALVAARRLKIWGANVRVVTSRPAPEYQGIAGKQLAILQQMGMVLLHEPPSGTPDLIIDGMIGYRLQGAPHGRIGELIEWANRQLSPVLALDAPSGLDLDTGTVHTPCMRASATLTLALPKTGLLTDRARPMVGELFLADISVPRSLYKAPGIELEVGPIFSDGDIVKLR